MVSQDDGEIDLFGQRASVRMSAAVVTGSRPAVGLSSTSNRGRARSSTVMLCRDRHERSDRNRRLLVEIEIGEHGADDVVVVGAAWKSEASGVPKRVVQELAMDDVVLRDETAN